MLTSEGFPSVINKQMTTAWIQSYTFKDFIFKGPFVLMDEAEPSTRVSCGLLLFIILNQGIIKVL